MKCDCGTAAVGGKCSSWCASVNSSVAGKTDPVIVTGIDWAAAAGQTFISNAATSGQVLRNANGVPTWGNIAVPIVPPAVNPFVGANPVDYDISNTCFIPDVTNLTCCNLFYALATLGKNSVNARTLKVGPEMSCHLRGQGDVDYEYDDTDPSHPCQMWYHGLKLEIDMQLGRVGNTCCSHVLDEWNDPLIRITTREW